MKKWSEIPPTAGLPMLWQDWLPTTKKLCSTLSELLDLPELLLECSGTASLIIALKTLAGMPENKGRNEVIIPAYNCPLVVLAIAYCNLKVKLCDIQHDHFDFDFDCLEKLLDEKTLAVIPTHIGGQLADVEKCTKMAKQHGIFVIEDGAQALGSSAGKIGDIVFFSLAVGKGLTLFEGGLLTARDEKLRTALKNTHKRIVKSHFFFELRRVIELFGYFIAYRPKLLPVFYGLPRRKELKKGNIEEAVGDVFDSDIPIHKVSHFRIGRGANEVHRLQTFLDETTKQAQPRIKKLENIPSLRVIKGREGQKSIWPFITVMMKDEKSRDRALQTLWPSPYGVTRLFVHSLGQYDYLRPYLGDDFYTPNADDFAARMLTISNSLWLDDDMFDKILVTLEKSISNNKY